MAHRIWEELPHFETGRYINHYGFGRTLAGSALQITAIKQTLSEVIKG